MTLFSDVYNCYYQVVKSLLEQKNYISNKELQYRVKEMGYEESILFLIPKLVSKEWNLYEKNGDVYISKVSDDFYVPLTNLQRSYLKALLLDEKIQLFLEKEQLDLLENYLADITPLWQPEDFYYFDRFEDSDDYTDVTYRLHFRKLLEAIKNCQYVDILYESRNGNFVHHYCIPCHLEYSIKNDRFRLLAIRDHTLRNATVEIFNLNRMKEVTFMDRTAPKPPNLNRCLKCSYAPEPVCLLIKNERNALERAMLQFANYEKNTTRLDENTYQCLIYYNKYVETELLIEVLSFGPMIQVVGNEEFLKLVKERLQMQYELFRKTEKS